MAGGVLTECMSCPLWKSATRFVPGEGDSSSRILLIGEAPGWEEDISGHPFVGDAGKLLRRMIHRLGLKDKDFYFSNIFRCRPSNNQLPSGEKILRGWINACAVHMESDLSRFFGKKLKWDTSKEEYTGTQILRRYLPKSNKSVVFLGGVPLLAFTGYSAITKFEGRQVSSFAQPEPWAKRTWASFHPAYALPSRRPSIEVNIYRVLYRAARQCRLTLSPKTFEEMYNDIGIKALLGG